MARRGLTTSTLGADEARRIALHAQGFRLQDRDRKSTWASIAREAERLQLLQIDSVNVLVRSHYLPLYARLGHYDMATLDKRSLESGNRHFFECWAHEASLVPMSMHPLMRWRMERARAGDGTYTSMDVFGKQNRDFLKKTLAFVKDRGPTRASEIPAAGKSAGGWWGWSKGKLALETLFDQGLVTTASRQRFERVYDLTERVIPSHILDLPTPPESEAFRQLIVRSAAALGIATETDLRDYFRLPVADARKAIAECLEAGLLSPVAVEGWKAQAYIPASQSVPKAAGGTALLSPFDPLVWNRDRAERLFNFHYRIELYTPEHKRKFGYYVLPFLHGSRLSGRVCLKADRATSTLLVNAAHIEHGLEHGHIAEPLKLELQRLAGWLGLESVSIGQRGNLAPALGQ